MNWLKPLFHPRIIRVKVMRGAKPGFWRAKVTTRTRTIEREQQLYIPEGILLVTHEKPLRHPILPSGMYPTGGQPMNPIYAVLFWVTPTSWFYLPKPCCRRSWASWILTRVHAIISK